MATNELNAVELLMGMDLDKVTAPPSRDIKIKRLSDIAGRDFFVTVRAIPGKRYNAIINGVTDSKNRVDLERAYNANVHIVLAGITSPDMKDKDLLAHYSCVTPEDLLNKIFTGGEITMMADAITELSGYGKGDADLEDEVKN